MNWVDNKLIEMLRCEFEKRHFVQVGQYDSSLLPTPKGFKDEKDAQRYLDMIKEDYVFAAYKCMSIKLGLVLSPIEVNIFILGPSRHTDPFPSIEITAFYQGRMYKWTNTCQSFVSCMAGTRNDESIKEAIRLLMVEADHSIDRFFEDVKTYVLEGRWPEDHFVSNLSELERT